MFNKLIKHLFEVISKKCQLLCNYFKKLPYAECPKCGEKGIYFSHEELTDRTTINVYHCKYCDAYFV